MSLRKLTLSLSLAVLALGTAPAVLAEAEKYQVDPAHSFIEFQISHLGVSFLQGRFNDLSGEFTYDPENPSASSVSATVKTATVDTNHAERDKHLRSDDFLDVEQFPEARFESSGFEAQGDAATLQGNLTLHGVTKPITVSVEHVGAGDDPWGGYRRGFVGRTTIKRSDFGISYNLGPAAEEMQLGFFIEGIRQ